MKKRWLGLLIALSLSTLGLFKLFDLTNRNSDLSAAPLENDPTVSEVAPASVINDSDTPFVITGTGFTAELSGTEVLTPPTVLLDSTALPEVGWVASTTLTSTVPGGFPVGVYTVTVENPDGGSGSLANALTVRYPTPEVKSVDPVSGTYGQTLVLTVTGTHFVPTPTISLGSVPCPAVGFVNSTTLTVTVLGDLLPGIHELTVVNPGPKAPQDELPAAFTLYSLEPTVTGIEPIEGPNDLNIAVVITGTGLAPTPTAVLGEKPLNDVTWVSETQLTAQVPWGMDPDTYALTVTNPGPNAPTAGLTDAFTVTEGIGVWNAGELYGGTVSDVLINPDASKTVYAEVQSIGLFRSDDGGNEWSFKFAPTADNTAIDPQSPNHIYSSGSSHHPYQFLWRSDDAGETWIPLTTTFPVTQTSGRYCWNSEAFKPYPVSGTLYVSACGHGGGVSGVISSTDRGESWEPATEGLTDTQVTDLAFHPTDPLTMVAGTANGNVFISHNGGATWTFTSQPVGYVHELDVNPTGDHEVWVATETFFGDPSAVLKSTNAELTEWTSVNSPGDAGYIDDFFNFAPKAWGDPYSQTVFIASGHKTTDGGESWTAFGPAIQDSIYSFTPHPTHTDTLYAGVNGEGVYKTTDGGATWQVINQGLTGIGPNVIQPVPGQPETAYAHSEHQFRIYKATQGGAVWQTLPITRVVGILVDPFTTTRIYAGNDRGIYISDDGGQTWPEFVQIGPPPEYEEHYWYWPKVLRAHPDQPGELLAGLTHNAGNYTAWPGSIYRSTDWGQTWTQAVIFPNQPISDVRDIAYDPISPTIVYAATGDTGPSVQGPLLKSTDGGETWSPLGIKGVIAIELEPDTHRLYISSHPVCEEGGQTSALCFSDDYGETWEPAGASPGDINGFTFAPGSPPIIYARTSRGLLKSVDRGKTWSEAAGSLGHVPIYAVAIAEAEDRTMLYAATTGGYVEDMGAQTLRLATTADTLVNAGVYRYTSRSLQVYLPLVLRAFAP